MGNKGEYFPEAYFLRGNLRYRAGDFPAAAADYRAYISAAGDRDAANLPLGYYRLGYSLFNAERYVLPRISRLMPMPVSETVGI